jgi:hypothetical protein
MGGAMLTERCLGLLTAYVDGELSNRQRKAVLRLLRRSAEARTLLRKLQEDARRLRELPRQRLAADFSQQVLRAIATRPGPLRAPAVRPARQPLWSAWGGLAAAAAVLLIVGAGAYVFFSHIQADETGGPTLTRHETPPTQDNSGSSGEHVADAATVPQDNQLANTEPKQNGPGNGSATQVAEAGTNKPEAGHQQPPTGDPGNELALTLPIPKMEMFQPKSADVAVPVVLKMADLDAGKLREELQKDTGFRLELPCRESAHAFERLQAALKANGVGLVVESVAQARLKRPSMHTNFVLLTDDLTPDELTKILQQAGVEDRKAEARRKGDGQFDALVVTRLSKDDRKELAELLGEDPKHATPVVPSPGRPETSKATAKGPEAAILVLPYNPERPQPGSAEVKQFLNNRKQPPAGAIQVLLVLRENGR